MTPKKVLLVANTDWYLFNFRLALAKFLVSEGMEVCLVSPEGKFTEKLQAQGFRWRKWDVGRRTMWPPGEILSIYGLVGIFKAENPDIVHHFTIKPVLYGSIAAKLAKIPAVLNSVTGLGYVFLKQGLLGKVLRTFVLPLYRFSLSHPHMMLTFENQNDRDIFSKMGLTKDGKNVVIPGAGVDAEYFQPVPEPVLAEPVVLFPARMLFDKGLATLIEAARILKRRCPVRFVLVGDTDPGNPTSADESVLRAWEHEGLVEWRGFQKDMLSVYQNCNIVTLPSLGEGLPTVLIEAAACERPIVTTDVSGCRDVVINEVNGLLVAPNQTEALADAIERLIQDPILRQRMGKAGRQLVIKRFTNEQVNREIFTVYMALLDNKSHGTIFPT